MFRPVEIKALSPYKIWVKYEDGTQGSVDLTHLAGKGVFKCWDKPQAFSHVHITADGAIEWETGVDLCPDTIYMRLTGKSPEEVFPNLKAGIHA